MSTTDIKAVIRRFNKEVIEQGNRQSFAELISDDFINHAAPKGAPNGAQSMWNTFENILRPALTGLKVEIADQIAEADKVTTRKTITGVLTGPLLGRAPTNAPVRIDVIDIVRIENGKYAEHWGINTLPALLASLPQMPA